MMVRDGYGYGLGLAVVAAALWAFTHLLALVALPLLLAAFFLWFFRDPRRQIPDAPDLIVSPADGKVTAIRKIATAEGEQYHVSIFLNVFNVHVNRAPVEGRIHSVDYKKGEYLNAMNPDSAERNEQNRVAIVGELGTVRFTQIAGLLARRIVFHKKVGDKVHRGERVGLIKFGSRVDVFFSGACELQISLGDHVQGGSSILARMPSQGRVETSASTAADSIRGSAQ